MRLLCDAIAFCYGPGTALKRILEIWRPQFHEITLLACETTKEYFSRLDLVDNLVPLDTTNRDALVGYPGEGFDVYLCVCNPVGYQYLASRAKTTAFVDFLFWMRTNGNAPEFGATVYLVEQYPGFERAVAAYSSVIPGLQLIPPLVKCSWPRPVVARNLIAVNLGGQRSPMTRPGENTEYPFLVVEALCNAAKTVGIDADIVVTADAATVSALASRFSRDGWMFLSLPHDAFLDLLSRARMVLTHPGLYSPFEAFAARRPTFFLPSSNYTQILQLRGFRECGLAPYAVDWADLGCGDVPFGLPEEIGVEHVLKLIARGSKPSIQRELAAQFATWLRLPTNALERIACEQHRSARSFLGNYPPILLESLHRLRNAMDTGTRERRCEARGMVDSA